MQIAYIEYVHQMDRNRTFGWLIIVEKNIVTLYNGSELHQLDEVIYSYDGGLYLCARTRQMFQTNLKWFIMTQVFMAIRFTIQCGTFMVMGHKAHEHDRTERSSKNRLL